MKDFIDAHFSVISVPIPPKKGSSVRYVLHVTVPQASVFDAYWYGYGTIVSTTEDDHAERSTYVIDYGADQYRAEYQAARFASGLYFAKVETVKS